VWNVPWGGHRLKLPEIGRAKHARSENFNHLWQQQHAHPVSLVNIKVNCNKQNVKTVEREDLPLKLLEIGRAKIV
jgi:hypothetical protein|tara:strand:- start:88 stop:312 length:225 start_codon:yes stop_codon:yes gene_type:complete